MSFSLIYLLWFVSYSWGLFSFVYNLQFHINDPRTCFNNLLTLPKMNESANRDHSGSPHFPRKLIIRSRSGSSAIKRRSRGEPTNWVKLLFRATYASDDSAVSISVTSPLVHKGSAHIGWHPPSFGGPADHSRIHTVKKVSKRMCVCVSVQSCMLNLIQLVTWMTTRDELPSILNIMHLLTCTFMSLFHNYNLQSVHALRAGFYINTWQTKALFPLPLSVSSSPPLCASGLLELCRIWILQFQAQNGRHVTGWSQGPLG